MSDSIKTTRPHCVRMLSDNYDITHNLKVRELYPKLFSEVLEHDKVSRSSWYDLSDEAYAEYEEYIDNEDIGYVK